MREPKKISFPEIGSKICSDPEPPDVGNQYTPKESTRRSGRVSPRHNSGVNLVFAVVWPFRTHPPVLPYQFFHNRCVWLVSAYRSQFLNQTLAKTTGVLTQKLIGRVLALMGSFKNW